MLPDATLRAIASNLAALNLDPVTYLRVAGAIVGPLMEVRSKAPTRNQAQNIPAAPRPGNGARRQTHGEPMARAREALEHDPTLSTADLVEKARVSRATAVRARSGLTTNGSKPPKPARSADAGLGANGAKPPPSVAAAKDHARAFLQERLARGPVPAADVDEAVDKGQLLSASVDRAKEDLDLVACRINLGHGPRVCLATREQAATLGTLVAEKGARGAPAPPPKL